MSSIDGGDEEDAFDHGHIGELYNHSGFTGKKPLWAESVVVVVQRNNALLDYSFLKI